MAASNYPSGPEGSACQYPLPFYSMASSAPTISGKRTRACPYILIKILLTSGAVSFLKGIIGVPQQWTLVAPIVPLLAPGLRGAPRTIFGIPPTITVTYVPTPPCSWK